jgi:hypothetical protein
MDKKESKRKVDIYEVMINGKLLNERIFHTIFM